MSNPKYAWCDGLVPWDEATCHVSSLAFKYGAAVFEGIRAYWDGTQLHLWQLDEHLARLEQGQRFMRFINPFSASEMGDAIKELLRANDFRNNVHITVTAFLSGPGPITQNLRARFDALTTGANSAHPEWRTPLA